MKRLLGVRQSIASASIKEVTAGAQLLLACCVSQLSAQHGVSCVLLQSRARWQATMHRRMQLTDTRQRAHTRGAQMPAHGHEIACWASLPSPGPLRASLAS